MNPFILSKTISVFYLRNPDEYCQDYPYPIYCPFSPPYSNHLCPEYMPHVIDSRCRLCGLTSINHRKYFIYSSFAFKIQKLYYQYKFKKFATQLKKENMKIDFITLLRYKYKFRRNWSIEHFKFYNKFR